MADDIEAKTIIGKITKGPTQDGKGGTTWIDVELLEPGQSKGFTWRAFKNQNAIREKAIWGKTYEWGVELKTVEGRQHPYRNIVRLGNEVEFPDVAPQAAQTRPNGQQTAYEDPPGRRVSIERQKAADLALQSYDIGVRMADHAGGTDEIDPLFMKSFSERVDYIHAAIVGVTLEKGEGSPQNGRSDESEPDTQMATGNMKVSDINGLDDLMRYARQEHWPKTSYDHVFRGLETKGSGWDAINFGFLRYQERTTCTWRELAMKMEGAEDDAQVWAERKTRGE